MTKKKTKAAVKVKRVTLGHHELRRDAETNAALQRGRGRRHVVVTGEQGAWKVRADAD